MAQVERQTVDLVLLSTFVAAETAHAFSAFLPSHFTIRTFALEGDPATVQRKLDNLRSGYVPALSFGALVGGLTSLLVRSPIPVLLALGVGGLMVVHYESALPPDLRLWSSGGLRDGDTAAGQLLPGQTA